jgi:hypothetical protein
MRIGLLGYGSCASALQEKSASAAAASIFIVESSSVWRGHRELFLGVDVATVTHESKSYQSVDGRNSAVFSACLPARRIVVCALALSALWPFGAASAERPGRQLPQQSRHADHPYPPWRNQRRRRPPARAAPARGTWTEFHSGQQAGAATTIGATAAARAPKDGYTLLLSAGTTFTVVPHMQDKLQYRLEDFEPVAAVCTVPFAFVVRKDFPANDLGQFIAYARATPARSTMRRTGRAAWCTFSASSLQPSSAFG